MKFAKITFALLATSLMAACGSSDPGSLSVAASDGVQDWQLSAPTMLLSRAVDQSQLSPTVTLNGTRLNMQPLGGGNSSTFQGRTQVTEGEDVVLRVDWVEIYNGRELLLAVAENTYEAISGDTNVVLREQDYVVDNIATYPLLDDDNDRVPNLFERQEGSDPLSPTDPGVFRADAFIGQIDPLEAPPVIDGSYDNIWGAGQFQDRDREQLYFNNRIVGFDPDRPNADGNTEFRWGGLHDGQYLYLYVLGERVAGRTTQGDSEQPWQDDSIDIYWDGNRSQGTTYDSVDDYHLIIPLVKLGQGARNASHLYVNPSRPEQGIIEGSVDPTGRAETGFNSQTIEGVVNGAGFEGLDGVAFATCVCPLSDIYEVRLDMEKLQIPTDRSFGFELQINNDIDGDTREFKFGWRAPAALESEFDADSTWEDPSTMGLLQLVPIE